MPLKTLTGALTEFIRFLLCTSDGIWFAYACKTTFAARDLRKALTLLQMSSESKIKIGVALSEQSIVESIRLLKS